MLARYIQVLAVDVHLNFIWRVETLIGIRHIKPFLLFVKKVTLANWATLSLSRMRSLTILTSDDPVRGASKFRSQRRRGRLCFSILTITPYFFQGYFARVAIYRLGLFGSISTIERAQVCARVFMTARTCL